MHDFNVGDVVRIDGGQIAWKVLNVDCDGVELECGWVEAYRCTIVHRHRQPLSHILAIIVH